VVDDNPENIELVKDVLDMAGHQTFEAKNGQIALAIAQTEQPDLILLDVSMPGMSGFDVCERLKGDDRTAHIPVIMLTALSDVDSRVHGLAAGAEDYLTKPFSPRELIARVDRSLKAKNINDDLRDKQKSTRAAFERFVAPPIVDQLLKHPEQVKLGGRLQTVTVLFADLEGFTSLAERTDPEQLLQLLNLYHSLMVKIILLYGGTIDKFIGDCVMALYNTPNDQPDHIARAVKSALHIQDEIYWFHQKLEEKQRMRINFGINTGVGVVGNVGTDKLMNFTAVGDTVNIAARLQGMAENGRILVSEAVYRATSDFVYGRSRGAFRVKGRSEPVETYEVSNTLLD
jgi:class 3 adenylate cyclase